MSAINWLKRTILAATAIFLELMVMLWLTAYFFTETVILTLTPSFMRTQKSLRGKVVVLTGGAGGVGQELVLRLARANAKVVLWDINEEGKILIMISMVTNIKCNYCYCVKFYDKSAFRNFDNSLFGNVR